MAAHAHKVLVAVWGRHGKLRGRHNAIRNMLPGLHCLRLTNDGYPSHPLYLQESLQPVAWVTPFPENLAFMWPQSRQRTGLFV